MRTMKLLLATLLTIAVTSCGGGGGGDTMSASSARAITAYSLDGVTGTINETAKTIAVTMPSGTNVAALVATFTTTGASVKVGTTVQTSGATANDFTSPVAYTLTAADGTTAAYTVTVTVPAASAKAITAYSLDGATGTIVETAKTIAVTLPSGTNVTALVATFTSTGASVKVGPTIQTSGTTANDFTNPVAYTVTAADGTTATYTVVAASGVSLPKTGGDDGEKGVACPNPRFTVGTGAEAACVTDNLTGLMWVMGPDSTTRIWADALTYAEGLSLCGYTDWRLPNRKELRSLVNYGQSNSATWLNTQGFSNVRANFYWSSTTYAGNTVNAWYVYMYEGEVGDDVKTANYLYVWPVRSGQ